MSSEPPASGKIKATHVATECVDCGAPIATESRWALAADALEAEAAADPTTDEAAALRDVIAGRVLRLCDKLSTSTLSHEERRQLEWKLQAINRILIDAPDGRMERLERLRAALEMTLRFTPEERAAFPDEAAWRQRQFDVFTDQFSWSDPNEAPCFTFDVVDGALRAYSKNVDASARHTALFVLAKQYRCSGKGTLKSFAEDWSKVGKGLRDDD